MSFIVEERKHLVGKIRDQNAGIAGAIVVGRIYSHASARQPFFAVRNPGVHRSLSEMLALLIDVQLVRLSVIGKDKVRPAIVVVIENSYAKRL